MSVDTFLGLVSKSVSKHKQRRDEGPVIPKYGSDNLWPIKYFHTHTGGGGVLRKWNTMPVLENKI